MKNFKKVIAAVLVMAVVATCAIGATVAWLQDSTQEVKNTFSPSTIDITLKETTSNYDMVPGNTISKDPKVTVVKGSEACWLFVEITKSSNYGEFLNDYVVADGWTAFADEYPGVYYREVEEKDVDQEFEVLKDNEVTVKTSVTKDQMDAVINGTATAPTLTFKAYAVQKANIDDASTAWTQLK